MRLPFRIQLSRGQSAPPRRSARTLVRLAVTGLTALGISQALPLPAALGQSYYSSVTATISLLQVTRSITVSPGTVPFSNCQQYHQSTGSPLAGLTRDANGQCAAGPVTVTIGGNVGSNVSIQGAPAFADNYPAQANGVWNLCGGTGDSACAGSNTGLFSTSNAPGADKYGVASFTGPPSVPTAVDPSPHVILASSQANSDLMFSQPVDPVGNPAGATTNEYFWLTGPFSTSDTTAGSFTTSINWIAS